MVSASPSSSASPIGDRYQPEVLAWLEDCAVPASLLISSGSGAPRSGPPRHLLGKVYLGRLSVLHLELIGQCGLHLQVRPQLILLLFHRSGVMAGSCGARPIRARQQGLVGVLFPGERLDLSCTTPVAQLAWLCIPAPLLLLGASIFAKPVPEPHLVDRAIHGFELALVPILDAFVHNPLQASEEALHRKALEQLEVAMLSTLLRLMPEAGSAATAPSDPALVLPDDRDLCQRADRWMRQHLALSLDLTAVATACHCSKRTLQHAFRTRHDCTPMQHLRRLRLTAMREQLQLGASVKEACASAGLPAIGRTSLQYFERFGESPSATSSRASLPADSAR